MDNDKQPSSGAENSGAMDPTQQAIFTPTPAPQPSQPPRDQTTITGSVVESASAVTGLSHQYYSNHPTKTSASGIGDIVIGKSDKKFSPKKLLVIGGIIALVLIIISMTVVLFSAKTSNPMTEAENKFYEFANYILYGQKQDDKLVGEYNGNSSYELDKQFFDRNDEFLNEAATLLNGAIEEYAKISNAGILLSRMQDIYNDLKFLITFLEIEEPDEEEILKVFLQSGKEASQAYLVRFYSPLWEMESTEAQQYAVQRYEQYSAMSEMLQIYSEQGCIKDGAVDMNCPLSSNTEKASELIDIMNSNERTAVTIIPSLLKTIESSCWQVSYGFQNITNLGSENL